MKSIVLLAMLWLVLLTAFADTAHAQRRAAGPPRKPQDTLSDVGGAKEAEEAQAMLTDLDDKETTSATMPSEFKPTMIPVPRTGQIVTRRAGDDGNHHKGQPWPEPRFTDNNDGTVADNLTGLVWLRNPSVFACTTWNKALAACNRLMAGEAGLSDSSKAGDWRLPNVRELESLIDYSQKSPALPRGHPFQNVAAENYWSSTTHLDSAKTPYRGAIVNAAWAVDFAIGRARDYEKTLETRFWPVRDPLPVSRRQAATRPSPPSPVPRTGQVRSWATGDDGDLQKGRPWPQPRFIDNHDGTVTDLLTGLIWLRDRRSMGLANWGEALSRCNELADGKAGLADGSKPGDWRLPNIREFQSLIDYSRQDPPLPRGHPFIKPSIGSHWTSTLVPQKDYASYRMGLRTGGIGSSSHVGEDDVWPVRGGR